MKYPQKVNRTKAVENVGKKTIKVPVNEKAIENIGKLFSQ